MSISVYHPISFDINPCIPRHKTVLSRGSTVWIIASYL